MRNLLLSAALAAGAAVVALAPATAQDVTGSIPPPGSENAAPRNPVMSQDWATICQNPLNEIICQGHDQYASKSPGTGPSQSPNPNN